MVSWEKEGLTWELALVRVHQMYNEKSAHHWCHTIPNSMIVCIALIYGWLDFERTIGIAVAGAFDIDCNAATSGSIIGMILGAKPLPEKWRKPLNN